MTAARVDLTVGFQEQHISLAARQLLLYCAMGNDRVCCIVLCSPNTLICWGSAMLLLVLHEDKCSQGSSVIIVKPMGQSWR